MTWERGEESITETGDPSENDATESKDRENAKWYTRSYITEKSKKVTREEAADTGSWRLWMREETKLQGVSGQWGS